MFVIKPEKDGDWVDAMFILSHYHALVGFYSNAESPNTVYMVVQPDEDRSKDKEDAENQLYLAEMCFQMNWHQYGTKLCPHCIDHADKFDTCGHLTFSKPVNPAF